MYTFVRELGLAARVLGRSPGFSLLVIAVLGVGLGSTIFMFGAIKGYILEPLPFPDSRALMHLECNNLSKGRTSLEVTQLDYLDWREQQRSFQDIAAFYYGTVNLAGDGADRPERFEGAFMTGNAFGLLPARAHLGRTLLERDSEPAAPDVVVLGYNLWMHRYAGDEEIVGRTVRVNGRNATVVGVMPRGFAFPLQQEIWVPLKIDRAKLDGRQDGQTLEVFGRLRDGVSRAQAQSELDTIAARLAQQYPDTNEGIGAVVKPYAREYVGEETRATLYTMFAAVLLVLIIACANTANLVLVRAVRRSREFAVRTALGADRRRLMTRVLAECLLLSLVAAVVGLVVADVARSAMITALRSGDADIPFWVDTSTDARVVFYAFGAALVSTLIAGLIPAFRATRVDVSQGLKEGGGGTTGGVGRLSRTLVAFEIALSCVLLVGAGLMLRSLINIGDRDYGANTENVLIGRMGLFEEQYPTPESRTAFFHQLVERLAGEPGVKSSAAATSLPGTPEGYTQYVRRGHEPAAGERVDSPWIYMTISTPELFDLLEVPLLQGRVYDGRDRADSEPVVVVSRRFAEQNWPEESAIGRQVKLVQFRENPQDVPYRTIIGVVEDVHMAEADNEANAAVFVPMAQYPVRFAYAAVRTASDPLAFAPRMRDVVLALDPDLPVYQLQTLEYWIRFGGWTDRLVAINFEVFGAIALLLAAVGMYAVLAYSVAQRTREIGVRRALGADDSRIMRAVTRQSLRQLLYGLVAGLALAVGFARLLSGMLVEVEPMDGATFLSVAVLLAVVSVIAAMAPTRRALRVNPIEALRHE